jgi:Ca2+-binding EF-hand superfamily protein
MLVAEADLNGDGVISIDEFCGMMKRRMVHACEGAKQEELRNIFKVHPPRLLDNDETPAFSLAERPIITRLLNRVLNEQGLGY